MELLFWCIGIYLGIGCWYMWINLDDGDEVSLSDFFLYLFGVITWPWVMNELDFGDTIVFTKGKKK